MSSISRVLDLWIIIVMVVWGLLDLKLTAVGGAKSSFDFLPSVFCLRDFPTAM